MVGCTIIIDCDIDLIARLLRMRFYRNQDLKKCLTRVKKGKQKISLRPAMRVARSTRAVIKSEFDLITNLSKLYAGISGFLR